MVMEMQSEVGAGDGQPPQQVIHCTLCDRDKLLDDFYPSGRGAKSGQCKGCVKKRTQDRVAERVAKGLPSRRKSRKIPKPKPPSFDPAQLMQAMAGPDPRFELAAKLLEMQQKTIELLLRERR